MFFNVNCNVNFNVNAGVLNDLVNHFLGFDVDKNTIATALTLSSKFTLSAKAHKRIAEAVKKLSSDQPNQLKGWEFGFGPSHPVRSLIQTELGVGVVALCCCLLEVLDSAGSSEILRELAIIFEIPQHNLPSLSQWQALLKACTGALAKTEFSKTAEQFLRHEEDIIIPHPVTGHRACATRSAGRPRYRVGCDPKEVAGVLKELACLSTSGGRRPSATFVGGSLCGWIAAVGCWFFGFDVEMQRDGKTVQHAGQHQYLEKQVALKVNYFSDPQKFRSIENQSNTHVIHDVEEALAPDKSCTPPPSGRTSWGKAIQDTFHSDGRKLLRERDTLSQLLGSTARAFAGIAQSEPDIWGKHDNALETSQDWVGYRDTSYGIGYLHSAADTFPELRGMLPDMKKYLNISYSEALGEIFRARSILKGLCDCSNCTVQSKEGKVGYYCLCILTEVVTILIWALSLTNFDPTLEPYRRGLEGLYEVQKGSQQGEPSSATEHVCRLFKQLNVNKLFTVAELVFASRARDAPKDSSSNLQISASVTGCMCFYLGVLRRISDEPEKIAILYVLPGCIRLPTGRKVDYIEDSKTASEFPAINERCSDAEKGDLHMDFAWEEPAKECSAGVAFYVRYTRRSAEIGRIGPRRFVDTTLRSFGVSPATTNRGMRWPNNLGASIQMLAIVVFFLFVMVAYHTSTRDSNKYH